MLIPISTEHAESRHRPVANLLIIALTCVVSIALMHRLPDAMAASLIAHGDPLRLDGWFRHLPLVRGSADALQLVGSTLLHGDGWHLFGNMLLLLTVGNPVNARLGQWRYLLLYAVSAAVAAIAWLLFGDGALAIGASGAVCGVLGAFLILFPLTRVNVLFWWTGLVVVGIHLILTRGLRVDDPIVLAPILIGVFVACTVVSIQSLVEVTPPEGALLRAIGCRTVPVAGFWVVLWFVGGDVIAVVGGLLDDVAHEAHLGGALAGLVSASVLALVGVVRGTREDPTLPELIKLVPPQPAAPRAPTFRGIPLPPTRRYNHALTFSDYKRQRLV